MPRDQIQTENLSIADLIRRGWNRTLITRLLGAEDSTAPNPHYPGSSAAAISWSSWSVETNTEVT